MLVPQELGRYLMLHPCFEAATYMLKSLQADGIRKQ